MHLPYVIDNHHHKLADILNDLLGHDAVHALDIASAYFNVGGFDLLRDRLEKLASFRLLLGSEPGTAGDLGLRQSLRRDLETAAFDQETLDRVAALIRFLRRETVTVRLYQAGFLHAKAYLLFSDETSGDRFIPVAGIVGSSNFTQAGLSTNQELNLSHKAVIDAAEADDFEAQATIAPLLDGPAPPADLDLAIRRAVKSEVGARAILELLDWYDERWAQARDFKPDLIELLNQSKFGDYEYTPYEIYLKTLYEYFRDELGDDGLRLPGTRSAVELTRFQEDAVKKARRILQRYDGVMVADSVGLGKTWIGKKLLEDAAYHQRQKALVICPASLRQIWEAELHEATIPADTVSQEMLGRDTFDTRPHHDVDVILIDESHNFRNHRTNRYNNLERLIGANGGKGRDGQRKRVILLTATPINNTIFDLYNQIMLFAQGDRTHFAAAGIGDLRRYFLAARRQESGNETAALFNLLEEVVIRRTRAFVRRAYPEATIRGRPIHWPQRELRTIRYNLEETYQDIYETVVQGIETLTLAPYNLESYKQTGLEADEWELGREQALVGIFKSRYLKRFESSVEAFRISVGRTLAFFKTFAALLETGKLLNSSDFRHVMRYLAQEDEDNESAPGSQTAALYEQDEARAVLETLPELDLAQYDLRRLRAAMRHDIEVLTEIWDRIQVITPERDAKLQRVKALLSGDLRGKKVLVFTYYRDTALYLYRQLTDDDAFLKAAGDPRITRMDGGVSPQDRAQRIARFAPVANEQREWEGSEREIDLMISTDVLSEGQNLQDCGHLVNYDLHWNPTRMVQRAGRIDRIGSLFETLWVRNVFPEAGLERLLRLVESLGRKIATIDQFGMLDTSVLGEIVHPRTFNTLQRIADEDESVFDDLEAQADLLSNEFLLATLQDVLAQGEVDPSALPDGIHSGRELADYRGLFFYFTAPPDGQETQRRHFWRYYDNATGRILDNRYEIASLIRCGPDEPRTMGQADVFTVQERVIEHILASVQGQQAIEAAPKILDSAQQMVAHVLQAHRNDPALSSREVRDALEALREPLPGAYLKDLRQAYESYQRDGDAAALLAAVQELEAAAAPSPPPQSDAARPLTRDDLHLVCWEYVWS
jgi:superfamily II DNA or RNA helicase